MIKKLQIQVIKKINIRFNLIGKRESHGWTKICVSLFLPFIAANAFSQEITEFDLGTKPDETIWWSIAAASNGSVWLAERGGHRIERITPSGEVTEYKTKDTKKEEIAKKMPIALGPDGNLWLLEDSYVVRIKENGEMAQYALPTNGGRLIFAGPEGNMWILASAPFYFKVNMQGAISNVELHNYPSSIIEKMAAGPDGSVWYTASNKDGDRIGKITRAGEVTEYAEGITRNALVAGIVQGPDGNMWFTESETGKIAKITPSGVITEYDLFANGIYSEDIVSGKDGNLWSVDSGSGRVVKIAPDGAAVGYHLQNGKRVGERKNVQATGFEIQRPTNLTVDPQGNIWFVGPTMGWVGRFTLTPEAFPFNQSMSTQEIVGMISRPKNPIELLKNIEIAANLHLMSRVDFYTDENLKFFFGGKNTLWGRKTNEVSHVEILNFGDIVPPRKDIPGGFDSVVLSVTRTADKHGEVEGKLSLSVMRFGIFPHLADIENIFGSDWSEDNRAFNPHRDQGPGSRIVYKKNDKKMQTSTSIEFGADSSISSFYYIEKSNDNE